MFAMMYVGAQTCSLLHAAYNVLEEQPGVGAIHVAFNPANALPSICIVTHRRRSLGEPAALNNMVELLETKIERLSSANPPINSQQPSNRRLDQKGGNDVGRAGSWRSASVHTKKPQTKSESESPWSKFGANTKIMNNDSSTRAGATSA
jgi:hypothetical protein